ncbi:hypothetical protein AB0M44_42395 [Streptosporangium subroseum]|uniref:MmyB family transcriptional regulator n=1 Tax=Streptosporangium subroseum TaxID=106412 RepID=UPI003437B15B
MPRPRSLAHLPPPASGRLSTRIPPSVQHLLAGLGDQPLAVFGADWTLLTWTPLWSAQMGDPARIPHAQRQSDPVAVNAELDGNDEVVRRPRFPHMRDLQFSRASACPRRSRRHASSARSWRVRPA